VFGDHGPPKSWQQSSEPDISTVTLSSERKKERFLETEFSHSELDELLAVYQFLDEDVIPTYILEAAYHSLDHDG
jgi:hypothetical protein